MTAFKGFPAGRVEAARSELAKAQRRLERAAARAGQEAPAAPVLTVVREYVSSTCRSLRRHGCGGWEGVGPCPNGCEATPKRRALVDLELQAPPSRLAGWDFLAVVEPMTGGNLIRQVPGAEVAAGELDAWRTGDIRCDACLAARHRKETFILRSDGTGKDSDGRPVEAGIYKQVGRQCLAAFLGGRSAADIVARLGWDAIVRAAGEEGEGCGGFGGGPDVYDPAEFLAWCCAIARLDGFVTRKMAQDASDEGGARRATSSKVEWLLGPAPTGDSRPDWAAARERLAPQPEDLERAAATLAWARALPGRTDYEQNLRLVAEQEACQPKHTGILASAVPAYARELGEAVRKQARGPGEHYGAIGERYDLSLTVEKAVPIEGGQYGPAVIVTMRDAAGRCFMWRTTHAPGAVGTTVAMKGTVKRHSEFRGERQTELTRCRVVHPRAPRPPSDKRRAAMMFEETAAKEVDPSEVRINTLQADRY